MTSNLYEQGYYETGTASVVEGQTIVNGHGTAWSQIVRPADDFGKHVGRPMPIESVDSDTQITLAFPWPGPSQTAAPYRISFTPYHVAYRQALHEVGQLLANGNLSALAGLEGLRGKFPVFAGAGAMELCSLAEYAGDVVGPSAAKNGNIALFDGNTGKQIKEGGTLGSAAFEPASVFATSEQGAKADSAVQPADLGSAALVPVSDFATAAQGARAGAAYLPENIVGSVSQSAGVPTGAVLEYGSNANGDYIRYADGTQICWLETEGKIGINRAYSKLFLGVYDWSFPAIFASIPAVNCSNFKWGTSASWGTVGAISNSSAQLRGLDILSRAPRAGTQISATAIGRWLV